MKRVLILFLSVTIIGNIFSQNQRNRQYSDYIEKYKSLAIKEQYKHGIPASIKMAQALLESNAGQSMLAVKAKNHFGIKCGNNWTGKTIHKNDDNPQDCFRSYNHVMESYEDHSLFLKRQRYDALYKIPIKEYKTWARELRRLGYATDPNYANKLIKIIEDYNLNNLVYENYNSSSNQENSKRLTGKNTRNNHKNKPPKTTKTNDRIIDYTDLLVKTTNNNKNCFQLKKDATIKEIAEKLNKKDIKILLFYNDMFEDRILRAGTYIYTSKKRNRGDSRYRSYTVKEGDSMHYISQEFGITLKALYKINNMTYGTPAAEGMTLFLQ